MMQPLDLQLLFSQLDNIGKQVSQEKEGRELKKTLDNLKSDQVSALKKDAVNEASQDGLEKLGGQKEGGENKNTDKGYLQKNKTAEVKVEALKVFKDPDIGNLVDLSG
ncbi:MAG: hypothetical protein Ta2G_01090 [Termitinemataceae bacterium]|nr:MAG: hypothetical protein Ta2G_01090 [Termitinemataceae bacterium]